MDNYVYQMAMCPLSPALHGQVQAVGGFFFGPVQFFSTADRNVEQNADCELANRNVETTIGCEFESGIASSVAVADSEKLEGTRGKRRRRGKRGSKSKVLTPLSDDETENKLATFDPRSSNIPVRSSALNRRCLPRNTSQIKHQLPWRAENLQVNPADENEFPPLPRLGEVGFVDSLRDSSKCDGSSVETESEGPQPRSPTSECTIGVHRIGSVGVNAAELCPCQNYSAEQLADNIELCAEVTAVLESGSREERRDVFQWLRPHIHQLSLDRVSCRLVQSLLESISVEDQDDIIDILASHFATLYESPNGNHVLLKAIGVAASSSLVPIIDAVKTRGWDLVARHQFGCRVFERLIEHCTQVDVSELTNFFVQNPEGLARHTFGNFVIQKLLEHGSDENRSKIVQNLLPVLPKLAMHRTASHVIQKALNTSNPGVLNSIVQSIIEAVSPHSLEEVAASRYGSYVVEEIEIACSRCFAAQMLMPTIKRRLAEVPQNLREEPTFARVAKSLAYKTRQNE